MKGYEKEWSVQEMLTDAAIAAARADRHSTDAAAMLLGAEALGLMIAEASELADEYDAAAHSYGGDGWWRETNLSSCDSFGFWREDRQVFVRCDGRHGDRDHMGTGAFWTDAQQIGAPALTGGDDEEASDG